MSDLQIPLHPDCTAAATPMPTWTTRPWQPREQLTPNPDTPVRVVIVPEPVVGKQRWWRLGL